jgi:hypothetical protein
MLTPRERAAGAFSAALAQGRSRVLGTDDMVEITETRLANARSAERMITAAQGTERHFIAEPDDARLEQMQQRLGEVVDTLEDDRSRWVARGGRR